MQSTLFKLPVEKRETARELGRLAVIAHLKKGEQVKPATQRPLTQADIDAKPAGGYNSNSINSRMARLFQSKQE
jgi:hypothetical protein